MRLPFSHRWIHALLALLLLVNGVLVAMQSAHHMVEAQLQVVEVQADDGHCRDHFQAASIDSGTDEHGHCFHVHLPAHGLISHTSAVDVDASSVGVVMVTPSKPPSFNTAPPVPPPNV